MPDGCPMGAVGSYVRQHGGAHASLRLADMEAHGTIIWEHMAVRPMADMLHHAPHGGHMRPLGANGYSNAAVDSMAS